MENPLDAMQALLDERSRYEQWLAQLAVRRDSTPVHVYERVRTDYAGRLESVMDQLRGRAADLEGTLASLEHRVNDLTGQETARRDARAEIELRAMVGEYESGRAEGELASCDADIARLVGEREGIAAELHRVQEILALVRQPVVTAPEARPEARPEPVAPPPAPERAQSIPPAAAAPERDSGGFDELAFLHSVVDSPAPVSSPAPIADRPAPPPPPPPTPVRPAVATPSATPVYLKDMPTEQVKTLRCQECGTMNYPTEWYCERCGGELAAM
jgi:hypothetical protein